MSIIGVFATVLLIGALGSMVIRGLGRLTSIWGEQTQPPETTTQIELNETEKEMVDKSRETIKEIFGDNLVETLKNANNMDRIKLMDQFANKLAEVYGLDITVDVTVADGSLGGYYTDHDKKVVFNLVRLMVDGDNPHFAELATSAVSTIIHELRHAVQWQSVRDPSFWNIGQERAQLWDKNFHNYIQPEVDFRGYVNQPVEADARAFAAAVLREV